MPNEFASALITQCSSMRNCLAVVARSLCLSELALLPSPSKSHSMANLSTLRSLRFGKTRLDYFAASGAVRHFVQLGAVGLGCKAPIHLVEVQVSLPQCSEEFVRDGHRP